MARRPQPPTPPAMPPTSYDAMMREVDALPLPPRSANELAAEASITQSLRSAADALRAENLANGLALAQQAAARRGPLVDVFAEIGRRYGHLLVGKVEPQMRGGANLSRTDFVGVLLDVAHAPKARATKTPHAAFRVIEDGAD